MPRPRARPHIHEQLKFVTNYMLAGCGPEPDLIFEMNTDALLGLMVLFVGISPEDIVQGFFDPRHKRARSPGRHGRKSRRGIGFPDISDEIGRRVSVPEIGQGLKKLPGGRWVLPGINILEGIAISAAVIEGITDVGYDNLAGLLDLNPNYCREFPRFRREVCYGEECPSEGYNGPQIVGGAGGANDPIVFRKRLGNTGFITETIVQKNLTERWAMSAEVIVQAHTPNQRTQGRIAIETDKRGFIAERPMLDMADGETQSVTIDALIEPDEFASVRWRGVNGFGLILNGQLLGYGQKDWLDWLPDWFS